MASEKKALGRTVVVAVDSSKRSDAAFQRALQEVHTDDCLLIVFARPVRSGDRSYVTATKGVQSVYDKISAKVLSKYSALATVAQVTFEAIEIEGHHADAAIADKCMEIGADLLIKPAAPSAIQRFVHGKEPLGNVCPACNPYLRGHGRLVQGHPCNMKRVVVQPCPVIVAGGGSGRYEDFQMQGGEYALLRPSVY